MFAADKLLKNNFEAFVNGSRPEMRSVLWQMLGEEIGQTSSGIDKLIRFVVECDSKNIPWVYLLIIDACEMLLVNGPVDRTRYSVASIMRCYCEKAAGAFNSSGNRDLLDKINEYLSFADTVMARPGSKLMPKGSVDRTIRKWMRPSDEGPKGVFSIESSDIYRQVEQKSALRYTRLRITAVVPRGPLRINGGQQENIARLAGWKLTIGMERRRIFGP